MLLLSTFLYKTSMCYKKEKKKRLTTCAIHKVLLSSFVCWLIAQIVENSFGAVSTGETEDENRTMVALYEEKKIC